MTKTVLLGCCVLFASAGIQAAPLETDTGSPRELIMHTSARFLDTLKTERERLHHDPALAYRIATDIVMPHIDFERFSRWVLGKHWRQATDQQRQRFLDEFRTLLMHTYVTAMVEYSEQILSMGNNLKFPPVPPATDANLATVRMDIDLENGKHMPVVFDLVRNSGHWKITDVSIEGVSLATTYRGTMSSQIRRDGIDGVIAALHEKNTRHPGNAVIKAAANQ